MARRYQPKAEAADENVFWTTMSDMFLGLMMVFMTLFIFAMTGFTQVKVQSQKMQSEVAKELSEKLKEQNIKAEVDTLTGQVKISDLDLFEVGSYELSENGKQYLNKFIPIYISTIFSNPKLSEKIINITIQGHTDSQTFRSATTPEQQYIKNMQLSLNRANAVEEHMFKTNYNRVYNNQLLKKLIVEGKGSTEPVLVNGKEDYAKSRRVELKLTVKEIEGIQDFFLNKNQENGG